MPIEKQIYLKNISQRKQTQQSPIDEPKIKTYSENTISAKIQPVKNQILNSSDGVSIDPSRRAISQL